MTASAGSRAAVPIRPGSAPAPLNDDHKLGALVSAATKDLATLVRDEIALAKAEMRHDMKRAAMGGGLFGAAGLLGLFGLLMLSFAAAYGLHAANLGFAWCWLIVAGVYLVIAAACGGIGLLRLKGLMGAAATKRTAGESIALLKRINR
jgi:hypothetical protein